MSFLGVGIVVVFSGVAIAQSPSASSSVPAKAGADDKAIRPFHFTASKEALADMRKRINATKWPEKETVTDTSQGVQVGDDAKRPLSGSVATTGTGPSRKTKACRKSAALEVQGASRTGMTPNGDQWPD